MFAEIDALGLDVGHDLADHVLVAGLVQVAGNDVLGVGLHRIALQAEQLARDPLAQQLVAAHLGAELQVLVVLVLECLFAFVECRHRSIGLPDRLLPVSYPCRLRLGRPFTWRLCSAASSGSGGFQDAL